MRLNSLSFWIFLQFMHITCTDQVVSIVSDCFGNRYCDTILRHHNDDVMHDNSWHINMYFMATLKLTEGQKAFDNT